MSTSIIKKLFTRREFIQSSAVASGAAIAASSISLPFNALAAPTPSSSLSPEQIRYSACLVNCGSRCPFKVHVRDGVAVKISPEDGVNEAIFVSIKFALVYGGAQLVFVPITLTV